MCDPSVGCRVRYVCNEAWRMSFFFLNGTGAPLPFPTRIASHFFSQIECLDARKPSMSLSLSVCMRITSSTSQWIKEVTKKNEAAAVVACMWFWGGIGMTIRMYISMRVAFASHICVVFLYCIQWFLYLYILILLYICIRLWVTEKNLFSCKKWRSFVWLLSPL